MRQRAKFHQNRSHGCRDTAIYGFQNGGGPPSWICEIQFFQQSERLRGPFCISVPNFVKIGQTITEISRFLWFSRLRPPSCWIFKNSNFQRPVPFFSLVRCGRLSRLLSAFERTLKSHLVSYRRAYDADSARRPTAVCLHSTSSVLTGQRPRGPSRRRRRRPASTRVPADSTRTARETRRHQTPRWRPRRQNGTAATTTTFQVPFSFCLLIPSVYSYPCHLR